MKTVRRLWALLAIAPFVFVAACEKKPAKPIAGVRIGTGTMGAATYAVAAASHARGARTYLLRNPRTHATGLKLFVADGSGRAYVDVIRSGTGTTALAIARDGVVLQAIGSAGSAEERAFLRAMLSPAPVRPLRRSATFTAALLAENDTGDSTNGKPSNLYKLFGMFPDGDDVELYLAVATDGRSVTFSEKDEGYRPNLTRFLSR